MILHGLESTPIKNVKQFCYKHSPLISTFAWLSALGK